ncbi:MAG: alpha-galactosidase [Lachnospiraceae bacterium]|nr:alpha-galactosidase [Lachnospiraceae bacterium]
MPIIYHEASKEFHLYNQQISYIIEIMENGQLGNLYYGKKVHDRVSFSYLHQDEARPLGALAGNAPCELCLQYTRQEYPSYGTGDYRYGACVIEQENGSRITDFKYATHNIYEGKHKIEPLPATYVENKKEATSIEITLYDAVMDTEAVLTYTIYEELSVITRHVRFIHKGESVIRLQTAMSACVDLPDKEYDMLHLSGAWARERYVKTRKLEQGLQSIYSMRGASSAEHNPFIALKRRNTTEDTGEVMGFSLVYSGSFLGQVEVCSHDTTRVTMGIHPDTFSWKLNQNESFQTPEMVMVYSDHGMNAMSQTFHELYRTRLARGYWRDRERPILLNNWEATYMDFSEYEILRIASKAKEVGVELFVLDDGWFGDRSDDDRGLGDWYVNLKKLPNGIAGLSRNVEELGMKFGIWIEPEMVNKNSDLYRAHPDWILSVPERYETPSRQQHVLDYSRKEVVDAIFGMLDQMISESKITYIKWDMNRYITECYSRTASPEEQGKVMHQYILGVYDLYTRLTNKYPEILFESCSSGGARFDPGMLYFAPQTWCSDDTDASERLKIQYGTSMVYPISAIGAHVSAVPNHQLERCTPLATRAHVAFFGAFGYELDLNKLTQEELDQVRQQIDYYKCYRKLIQQGIFYRIKSPFAGNDTAWLVAAKDQSEAIAAYYQRMNLVNAGYLRLKLTGLCEERLYEVTAFQHTEKYYGSELMYAGIPIDRDKLTAQGGDFASVLFHLKAVK